MGDYTRPNGKFGDVRLADRNCSEYKRKKNKTKFRRSEDIPKKPVLEFKEDCQEYAYVTNLLGACRLQAYCFDGVSRLCRIRGKMRGKVWIRKGDLVLVSLREYQDNRADVILKYNAEEATKLVRYGELPEYTAFGNEAQEDGDVEFVSVESIVNGNWESAEERRKIRKWKKTVKKTGKGWIKKKWKVAIRRRWKRLNLKKWSKKGRKKRSQRKPMALRF